MKKLILTSLIIFCSITSNSYAQYGDGTPKSALSEEQIRENYKNAGKRDAKELNLKFQRLEKPKHKKAYEDYKKDLEYIRVFGHAPENEALYDDLRKMNSNESFVYSRNKRDQRPIYKPLH